MPSRSINAPKSVRFLTTPLTVSPDLHGLKEPGAFFGSLLLDDLAAAEHDVFALVIDLDDLEVVGVADELLEILGWNDIDLRTGEERFDADIDGQAAFDHGFHLAFDQAIAFEDLDNFVPVLLVSGLFL